MMDGDSGMRPAMGHVSASLIVLDKSEGNPDNVSRHLG